MLFLGVLTVGEIRNGIDRLEGGKRRMRLETWLSVDLRARFRDRILPVDTAIAGRWGGISAIAAANGRPVPVIDGLLAATAMHHHLVLVTRNGQDVLGTTVPTIDPWSWAESASIAAGYEFSGLYRWSRPHGEWIYILNSLNNLISSWPELRNPDCYILTETYMYDQFLIPYQSTLGLIPDEIDQTTENDTQTPIQGLCVKTVRIVRALLDTVLAQFPEVGPALAAAFSAYDNGTLKFNPDTGRILTT